MIRLLKTLLVLLTFSVFVIGQTNSFYSDSEGLNDISLSSGSVDLSLLDESGTEITSPFINDSGIVPEYSSNHQFRIHNSGGLDFQYKVEIAKTGGDADLCTAFNLVAHRGTSQVYSGPLLDFAVPQSMIVTSIDDLWTFDLSFHDTDWHLKNQNCAFDIKVSGWQIGSDGTWGFTDSKTLTNNLATGTWLTPPPVISNVASNISTPGGSNQQVATITWDTNESATSNLRWRTDATWTDLPTDTSADNTHHQRLIEGLLPDKTYYYQVLSQDEGGNESISAEYSFVTQSSTISLPALEDIVINEYLPNPLGDDAAPMPGGQWVELYNRGTMPVDLTGWYLLDSNINRLDITTFNAVTSDSGTSDLILAPAEFMVVYRNGTTFDINVDFPFIQLELKNDLDNLIDTQMFVDTVNLSFPENKSTARFPDGSDTWFDPIPSPLWPNLLEPVLTTTLSPGRHYYSFTVSNVQGFVKLAYEVVYDTATVAKGFSGADNLNNQSEYQNENILLGSISSGGGIAYDQDVKHLKIVITLTRPDGSTYLLERTDN